MHPLALLPFLLPLSHSFSLDTRTSYWGYTTASLANTTSQQCKDAYSADIQCYEYLAMLANTDENSQYLKNLTQANLTDTCTATCQTSLTEYISNVKTACSASGDAALKGHVVWSSMEYTPVPVETVGHIFEYTLMQACAKDDDGKYCSIQQSGLIPSDFTCNMTCAVAYYWNQHEYPYGEWSFGNTDVPYVDDKDGTRTNVVNTVLTQHSVLFSDSDPTWTKIEECGFGNGTAPFDTGIVGGNGTFLSMKATTSANKTGASSSSQSLASGSAVAMRNWMVLVSMVLLGVVFV